MAQVIFALPAQGDVDYTMRMFNNDGSEPEMCGNGIRCLARFVAELDGDVPRRYRVHTLAGLQFWPLFVFPSASLSNHSSSKCIPCCPLCFSGVEQAPGKMNAVLCCEVGTSHLCSGHARKVVQTFHNLITSRPRPCLGTRIPLFPRQAGRGGRVALKPPHPLGDSGRDYGAKLGGRSPSPLPHASLGDTPIT